MIVPFDELDLELDPAEEDGGRMEDDAVDAGLERIGETGPAVPIGVCDDDLLGAVQKLDGHSSGRATCGRIEHMGRERGAHRENLRA